MDTNITPVAELPWTGERLVPSVTDQTAIEHLHRYSVALNLAAGKRVLDIASGEGYGSDMLARVAQHVIGVDICPDSVNHAAAKYRRSNLEFRLGDCAAIPVETSSVDLVVSFETIEHHDKHHEMMKEIKRVLRPDGVLIISSPNKRVYSDLDNRTNSFHVKELYRDEFVNLLGAHFKSHALLGQLMCDGSVLCPVEYSGNGKVEIIEGDFQGTDRQAWVEQIRYFVAIATDSTELPLVSMGIYDGKRLEPTRQQYMAAAKAWCDHQEATIAGLNKYTAEVRDWNQQLQAAFAEKEKEIAALRESNEQLRYRVQQQDSAGLLRRAMNWGRRFKKIVKKLAPPNTVRHRLCRKVLATLKMFKQNRNAARGRD